MLIRLALEEDFDAIVEMARANAATTRATLTFNEARTRATLQRYLDTACPTIWVAEERRRVVGFLSGALYDYDAFDGQFAIQQVLYVDPARRGSRAAALLMKTFIAWSERLGAKEIVGGNDNEFNSERTAGFLEHFGFRRVGFAMRKEIG